MSLKTSYKDNTGQFIPRNGSLEITKRCKKWSVWTKGARHANLLAMDEMCK
jgi:hypothetical protein